MNDAPDFKQVNLDDDDDLEVSQDKLRDVSSNSDEENSSVKRKKEFDEDIRRVHDLTGNNR